MGETEFVYEKKVSACALDRDCLELLQQRLVQEGAETISFAVGCGKEVLKDGREVEGFPDLQAACDRLEQPFASLVIAATFAEGRMLLLELHNFMPAGGLLRLSGKESWGQDLAEWILDQLKERRRVFTAFCYNRIGFALLQTGVPFLVASVIVVVVAGIVIPGEIRRSSWSGWITAGCLVLTLRVAYSISNWLLRKLVERQPFLQWSESVKKESV